MKQAYRKFSVLLLAAAFLAPVAVMAQKDDKGEKGDKGKKETEEIIIVRKGDKAEKVVVEVNGDKITVNGKPIEEYKDDDISVRRHKVKDMWAMADGMKAGQVWSTTPYEGFRSLAFDQSDRAMLGVTTESSKEGVLIKEITKESAAEKAGLKSGDLIRKVGDAKIETPDDLTKAISAKKPGDKVDIAISRDKKDQTVSAELSKWKGSNVFFNTDSHYNLDMKDFNLNMNEIMPKLESLPRARAYGNGQVFGYTNGAPKLGLSVQDTEDGKGVKVLEVDDDSNAQKAGLKEDDVITEVDGKAVNSADEVAKIIRASKEKISVMVKLQRGGKTQNIEVKMPRKLKTADL